VRRGMCERKDKEKMECEGIMVNPFLNKSDNKPLIKIISSCKDFSTKIAEKEGKVCVIFILVTTM
jgi:hypothetical protein